MTLVIDPDLTEENQKKLLTKIKKIITDLEGDVVKSTEWGEKELAYPIRKKDQAFFHLWELKLPEDKILEIDKKIKLEEEILRYLLVRKESPTPVAKATSVRGKGGKHGAKVTK